jgi:FkbM family methyltransferase
MSESQVERQYERNLDKAIALLINNPDLVFRIASRKALTRALPFPRLPTVRQINGLQFPFEFNFDLVKHNGLDEYTKSVIKAMYYGSYELLVIETMRRYLRPGQVFVDIGASLGYHAAVAAGCVGLSGQVHCFEPVPQYFRNIARLAELNPDYMIIANEKAVGEVPGTFMMNVDTDIFCGSTLIPDALSQTNIEVSVTTLDDYVQNAGLTRIDLLHVEVEGFEMPVLKGSQRYFERHKPPIICAVFPGYYPVQGYHLTDLRAYMYDCGYVAHKLSQPSKPIDIAQLREHTMVLFLPASSGSHIRPNLM